MTLFKAGRMRASGNLEGDPYLGPAVTDVSNEEN
jgi:hypothetical protein